MAIDKVADPFDLIQHNFPEDSEEKFATSAASLTAMVGHHNVIASEYRSAIAGLSDEVFKGLTADASRDQFGKSADSHEAIEQFCQKLAESFGSLGLQILSCKNQINSACLSATAEITQLEMQKALVKAAEQQDIQKKIDKAKKDAREDISTLHQQLEQTLQSAETSLGQLHDQMEATINGNMGTKQADAAMGSRSTPTPDAAMSTRADVGTGDALGSAGSDAASAGSGANNAGAEQLSNQMPMNPASMMGAMPQQMPQPGGGGMGSQLPGQELASKAMDMAQNMGGKDNTVLSDSAVKDLLSASGEHSGAGGSDGGSSSDSSGLGGDNNSGSGHQAGTGGPAAVGVSNPTVASGPSPATPVSSARPSGGPSVAMTELAGAPATSGSVSGLTSAGAGLGGLASGPATQVAAATGTIGTAANAAAVGAGGGFGAPVAFTPTAGTVGVPSTAGVAPVAPAPPTAPAPPAAAPPSPQPPAQSAPPPAAPPPPVSTPVAPTPTPPPLSAPPVAPGITAVPTSMGTVPAGVLELLGPPGMLAVAAAAPPRLQDLPVEQRITILNTASIVTQMRERGWPASVATMLIDDGVRIAVAIATGDDLSILPADITIPRASILLHGFHLGERFRSEWAGNADTVTKLVAAVDRHPGLNRSMIKHACAFTRNTEIRDPGIPFTPMSMDAAWAIRYLYTAPRETAPAYTLRAETFAEEQIRYLLGVAERRWHLPTTLLRRDGQARLESASMFASRWSETGEAQLTSSPRGYDNRIAGYLYAATREALLEGDLERASWYAQYLRYQTLPTASAA
ncbi:hypothetical protein QN239_31640 [Mycolicibacterium sp. Y3]